MDNTYLIEVTQAEKSAIVEALRRVRASSPLIEEIETLEPHRGIVIEGPQNVADQLRVVSSQDAPALPVFYASGEGAQRLQLSTSFNPDRVAYIASMVFRDTAIGSLARALHRAADDLLAHINDAVSDDLNVIIEAAAESCRDALAGLRAQPLTLDRPQKYANSELTQVDTHLLPALDFA